MSTEISAVTGAKQAGPITLSRWVNEPALPITEVLSAHDVARLTRRPIWLLTGMAWIGHFPKKLKHRGRRIGWCRSDVLAWLARDLSTVVDRPPVPRRCAQRASRQTCLPLECRAPCEVAQRLPRRRR